MDEFADHELDWAIYFAIPGGPKRGAAALALGNCYRVYAALEQSAPVVQFQNCGLGIVQTTFLHWTLGNAPGPGEFTWDFP